MGTDRYPIYEGPCRCGQGRFKVQRCEPDHPYFPVGGWCETEVVCPDCSSRYELIQQGGYAVVVARDDLQRRDELKREFREKCGRFFGREDVRTIISEFERKLATLPNKAAVYRFLAELGFYVPSQGTFSRKWRGPASWTRDHIHSPSHIPQVLRGLGRHDTNLANEAQDLNELYRRSEAPIPVVGDPLVRTG